MCCDLLVDRKSCPADGDADVAGNAARKVDDLIADAITSRLQVVGPELEYLLRDSRERFLPACLKLIDGSASVGAEHVGKPVDLNFGQAVVDRALNHGGGELDLLVF